MFCRYPEFEDLWIDLICILGVYRSRTTRENDAYRSHGPDLGGRDCSRHNFGKHMGFANPTCDQLRILCAKINNENLVEVSGRSLPGGTSHGYPIPTCWDFCSALPSVWSAGATMTSAFWNSLTLA